MKNGILKTLAVATALGTLASFAAPQSGPVGRRQPPPGGGGGGGGSRRQDPPPPARRNDPPPPSRRNDPPPAQRNDPPPMRRSGEGGGTRGGGSVPGNSQGGGTRSGGVFGGGSQGIPGQVNGGTRLGSRPNFGSRSGRVQYGTLNNYGSRGDVNATRIGRSPGVIDNGILSRRVHQSEQVGLVVNGIRIGYYHYNQRWSDDWFAYPHYVFDPYAFNARCYTSPWYYYYSLPAYLNPSRVIIVNNFPTNNYSWEPYRWQRNDGWDRRDRGELDYSLQDLSDAFERADRRSAGRLVPRNGNVNIYTDGRYGYSLNADDFYDLFMDGMHNNDTRRYEIVNVQMNNRGDAARVDARHESLDPWGSPQTVYHQYYLVREGRSFVIREFGTSIDRGGRW